VFGTAAGDAAILRCMSSVGTVRLWHAEDGWGVIDASATPGGCWTHYSAVLVPGYRARDAGEAVEFTFEAAEQDGFAFRAVEVWPAGQVPVRSGDEVPGPSSAHRSTLTLTFDGEDETRTP
jgi:CspA family cold shock protein